MSASQGYTVLIDGYNVIRRHAAWDRLPLREARRRLLELLARTRWPVPTSSVVVVFDGPGSDMSSLQDTTPPLRVQFAAPSADACIQEAIRLSASPHRLLVLSDDGEILRTAKSHGAQRRSAQWLFQRSSQRTEGATARTRDEEPDKASLPPGAAKRITEELATRWLKRSTPD